MCQNKTHSVQSKITHRVQAALLEVFASTRLTFLTDAGLSMLVGVGVGVGVGACALGAYMLSAKPACLSEGDDDDDDDDDAG